MNYNYEISLDLSGKGLKTIHAKQGDFETRILVATLLKNGEIFQIPNNVTARIAWNKPDGNQVLNDCEIQNNKVVFTMTQQMLVKEGEADCEIMLFQSGKLLTSAVFKTVIMSSAYDQEAIESSSEYTAFTNKLADIEDVLVEATEVAKEAAKTAQEAKIIVEEAEVDEKERKENEKVRVVNEEKREGSEIDRSKSEENRILYEDARIEAENIRIENEKDRIDNWNDTKSEIEISLIKVGRSIESADSAATNANSKADLAQQSADNADEKAHLAEQAAQNVGDAIKKADIAADNADEKANLAYIKAMQAQQATTDANDATQTANKAADRANVAAQEIEDTDFDELLKQVGNLQSDVNDFPKTYVSSSRKINNKSLTSDITLTSTDVGASPTNHASTSTSYGVATTSSYGHVKYGKTSSTACVGNDERLTPIGTIMEYGGASAPTGYLLCQGQAVSRTTYSALYSLLSTRFGSGNGTSTFNIPDFQTNTAVGYKSGDSDFGTIGKVAGEKSQSLVAQIGAFDNGLNSIGYNAVPVDGAPGIPGVYFYSGVGIKNGEWANSDKTPSMVTKVSTWASKDPSHIQPSLTVNYIIKY